MAIRAMAIALIASMNYTLIYINALVQSLLSVFAPQFWSKQVPKQNTRNIYHKPTNNGVGELHLNQPRVKVAHL